MSVSTRELLTKLGASIPQVFNKWIEKNLVQDPIGHRSDFDDVNPAYLNIERYLHRF